ncbi:MFS transporter [Dactylosporangium aurantiacum]|uniref:MFS transporter n=1 Tax=Dactylosporangium aurantiacum TaxID=35754 RepID=A0A9Q9MM82_9ACTN|nr:MFS transporter [Dactylosporangium aurantiacum]MDG6109836.1 MFS transporter [Dactylosporangium aurantiacum]UWZ57821.1 MFS transporter [Dactylosporangium aurantiacum]
MTLNEQAVAAEPVVPTPAGRWAVTAVFFLNGLTLSTYIVRAPSFKEAYRLTDGRFGLTGLLFAVAALACMQVIGPLTARVGARAVLRVTLAVMPLLLAGIAVAPGAWWFTALAPVLGAVHGATDAAMNTSAVAVERRAGRPVLNGCHAAWSISAVVASLAAAALAHAGVSLVVHLVTAGGLLLVAGLAVGPRLPEAGRVEARAGGAGPWTGWSAALLALGLTATALMVLEGAVLGWGGIFLHEERHATLSLAAAAITAFTGGQTAGRLVGDRLTGRWGGNPVFRVGALIAAGGLAAAVLTPHPAVALAGFALAGLGSSVLIPLTFSAVGRLPGAHAATLISRLTTFTYTGILLGPALIGWTAGQAGLAATMAALIPLPIVVALVPRPPETRLP